MLTKGPDWQLSGHQSFPDFIVKKAKCTKVFLTDVDDAHGYQWSFIFRYNMLSALDT